MSGAIAILGLAVASVGAGWLFGWPAGLIVFGAGVYVDSYLPARKEK